MIQSAEIDRRIFDAACEALFLHDVSGRILRVNAEMCAMFGYTADEALTLALGDLASNERGYTQAEAEVHLHRALTLGRARFEWRSRRRDGVLFWSEIALRRFEHEGATFVIASVRDIDARKQVDEELRESEERFAKIFSASSTMLAFTEPSRGCIVDVNTAWLAATGLTRDEAIGKTGHELSLWVHRDHRDVILAALAKDGRALDFETELNMGGKVVPTRISIEYVDLRGRPYILWEIRDVSAEKRAEREQEQLRAQLLQAQKMESVGQLAGGVAHDFNNMLSVILGFTSLATKGLVDERRRAFLDQVTRAGERAAQLTRQLLAFSRKQVMQPRVVDPVTVLRDMDPMLRRLIGEHIAVVVVLPEAIRPIKADVAHLEQAIMNLVVNARDAMPHGGTLTVEATNVDVDAAYAASHLEVRPGPYVMIAVSDTGTGMDDATRTRAFEPFFTTKGPGRGTGLGLSTVYGIVKQSGGAIWLYSEPGHGTTFKLFFPCTSDTPSAEDDALPLVVGPRGGETILLVEDDAQLRELAVTVLRGAQCNVLEAKDPLVALALAEAHDGEIHLLLTDVIMPHMNGKQLAEKLTALRPGLRVLYMSGYTENTIVHQGVVDEGVSFLAKPITPDRLLAAVQRTLSRP